MTVVVDVVDTRLWLGAGVPVLEGRRADGREIKRLERKKERKQEHRMGGGDEARSV